MYITCIYDNILNIPQYRVSHTGTAKNAHRRDPGTPAPNWPGPRGPCTKLARTPGPQHQIGPDPGPWGGRVTWGGSQVIMRTMRISVIDHAIIIKVRPCVFWRILVASPLAMPLAAHKSLFPRESALRRLLSEAGFGVEARGGWPVSMDPSGEKVSSPAGGRLARLGG